ncbi:MAG: HAD family phosphatase [Clostridia bacterium]|nr:HAD family phosphatase [Clostridia bacterium]
MDFRGAIFDLDGTIIDSISLWEKVALDWARKNHVTIDEEFFDAAKYGKLSDLRDQMLKAFPSLDLKKAEREVKMKLITQYMFFLKLKEGAREYLEKLKSEGISIALATSSPKMVCDFVIKQKRLSRYFDKVLLTDSFSRGKEFPDIFLKAAESIGVNPSDCIVFEDNYKAIAGVHAAGMRFCAIYDAHSRYNKFLKENADVFIYSFRELL